MKIIVTGAGGLLGHDVWSVFEPRHTLVALGRTQPPYVATAQWRSCDLTDAARTYSVVTKENPDMIVHCAAYNNVDGAETDLEAAFQGNAMTNRNLALACQRFDTILLSISTDTVFDGENPPESGYREFDSPNPINHYAESKLWGEMFVKQLLNKFYIVRTSWLFGPARPTWVDQLVKLCQEEKPIYALKDMVSAPTYTPDLAEGLLQLAESHHFGTYHLTNSGFCSRVELAEEVLRIHRKSGYRHLKALEQKELNLPAPRPRFSGLQNLAWTLDGFKSLRSWKEALADHFSKSKVLS